jgi:ATP-dependent 26S proteasome regulatory subunit
MALMIPLAPFLVAIVAILVKHQQRMAEIMAAQNRDAVSASDVAALREEIRAVREAMTEQSLALEALRDARPLEANLQDRVRS